jgi:hypothetical protein
VSGIGSDQNARAVMGFDKAFRNGMIDETEQIVVVPTDIN